MLKVILIILGVIVGLMILIDIWPFLLGAAIIIGIIWFVSNERAKKKESELISAAEQGGMDDIKALINFYVTKRRREDVAVWTDKLNLEDAYEIFMEHGNHHLSFISGDAEFYLQKALEKKPESSEAKSALERFEKEKAERKIQAEIDSRTATCKLLDGTKCNLIAWDENAHLRHLVVSRENQGDWLNHSTVSEHNRRAFCYKAISDSDKKKRINPDCPAYQNRSDKNFR